MASKSHMVHNYFQKNAAGEPNPLLTEVQIQFNKAVPSLTALTAKQIVMLKTLLCFSISLASCVYKRKIPN